MLEVKINSKKVLYGTFYIPPRSTLDIWNKVEDSIGSAVNDINCDNIIVTGDFNDNQLQYAGNLKTKPMCTKYSLSNLLNLKVLLILLENSSSLIDLISTDNPTFVLYVSVGPLSWIKYVTTAP